MGHRKSAGKLVALAAAALVTAGATPSHATLIAGWDFQTTTDKAAAAAITPGSPTTFIAPFGIGAGVSAIHLNPSNGASTFETGTIGTELSAGTGSSLNLATGFASDTTSPAALQVMNSSANGKSLIITTSMAGYQDLVITYATMKINNGFNNNQWSYRTSTTAPWTVVEQVFNPSTSYSVVTIDLSAITSVDNKSTVYFRYTLGGASTSGGYNRIDNFQINASPIPEPGSAALVAAGTTGLLRRRGRRAK